MPLLSHSVVFFAILSLDEINNCICFSDYIIFILRKNESIKFKYWKNVRKFEREKTIGTIYNSGHPIDDIQRVSGFISRSSVS